MVRLGFMEPSEETRASDQKQDVSNSTAGAEQNPGDLNEISNLSQNPGNVNEASGSGENQDDWNAARPIEWTRVNDIKWADWYLCRLLFTKRKQLSLDLGIPALQYYLDYEKYFQELEMEKFAAEFKQDIRCLIITPFDYKRILSHTMTHYLCHVPVLKSAAPMRLKLDVSSGVPNFSHIWEQYLEEVGGTLVDSYEYEVEIGDKQNHLMPEYDCAIFHGDTCRPGDGCLHLWELFHDISREQVFAITGAKAQDSRSTSNLDFIRNVVMRRGISHESVVDNEANLSLRLVFGDTPRAS
ncbi:unnamed protein product [Hydatigera taeniaeformis]|uniref:NYN domain-containing protein n=1 Tax=Hydatigena taeniaeformis TaxID=6205 RepID=A0A0R3X7J9_HYDTA|nr:unnamed protein product [Hydatigera taeniaeformis]